MEEAQKLKSKVLSEINVCDKTEKKKENLKRRSEEIKAAIDSDQQTKHICGEGDHKENLDDPNKMVEVRNDQPAIILGPRYKANSCSSSLKKEINIKRKLHETAARTNPVSIHPTKFQRKNRFRRSYKHLKRKEVLRRKSLKALRRGQRHISRGNMVSESSSESNESLEFQDLFRKKPSIADENSSEKKKDSIRSQKSFSDGNMASESSCENDKSFESQDLLGKKPRIADENNLGNKNDSIGSQKPLSHGNMVSESSCENKTSLESQDHFSEKQKIADGNNSGNKNDSIRSQKSFSGGTLVSESSCENDKSLESEYLLGKKPRIADEDNSEEKKDSIASQKPLSHGNMVSESSCENDKSLKSEDLFCKKPCIADENNSEKKKDSIGSQKPFSHRNMVSESSCENKTSLESQDHFSKKRKIADENNSEKKKDSLGSSVAKPLISNELQCSQSTSSKQSQEVSTTNKSRRAIFARPIFTVKADPAATKSHSLKARSGDDVWEHFIWHLKTNKDWLDRFITDGISGENVTTPQCESPETDRVRTELQDNLGWEMPEIRDTISISPLRRIEYKRLEVLYQAKEYENVMKKITVFAQQTEDMEKKIDCFSDTRKLRKMLHSLMNYLCDFDTMFHILKEEESNSPSLTEPPSLEPMINTFSSLFLCQYLSLYFEIPIEKIIRRVDFANYRLACTIYRDRKEKLNRLREMRRTVAETSMCYFINSLDSCRNEMQNEILEQEDISIEDLRTAVEDNIICFTELLSTGSLVVSAMLRYLNESRRHVLDQLFFLDKRRPDVFT